MKASVKYATNEIDAIACFLHNNGADIVGNTQDGDVEWFARTLYQSVSTFGMGWVKTIDWSLSNEDFKMLRLTPDRSWTNKKWDTLTKKERTAWLRLSFAVLSTIPAICDRIGHRSLSQSKAIRVMYEQQRKARLP
jgi:hypothetical protein